MSASPILVIFSYVQFVEVHQFSLAAFQCPNMLLDVRTSCPDIEFANINLTIGVEIMYANPVQALITLFTPVVSSSVSPILLYAALSRNVSHNL